MANPRRQRALRQLGGWLLAALLIPATVLVWGLLEPYAYEVERETATIPGLPPAWEGRQIAQIADLQVGLPFDNSTTIRWVADKLVELQPAAVLISGDFIVGVEGVGQLQPEVERLRVLLQPLLASGIPVYAVLGNHDYLQDEVESVAVPPVSDMVAAALKEVGVVVLRNEAVALGQAAGAQAGADALYLGGIDSLLAGRAKPDEVLAAIPDGAPRILLMHHPDLFPKLPPSSAPLAVAGHTHGGQIRVPGFPQWSWMALRQKGQVTADGWIDSGYGAPGNRLYVNRGMGFSSVPMRINCPPELTWFRLQRAQG